MPSGGEVHKPKVARAAGKADLRRTDPLARVHKMLDDEERLAAEQWKGTPPPQRIFRRWPFRTDPLAVQLMTQGSRVPVKMVPRDISCYGVGLLHTAFVYPGTKVVVRMRPRGEAPEELSGVVVRCKHRGGAMHQLGVTFDEQIDPSRFEPSIAEREKFALEQVDLGKVRGVALHIEDSTLDRALLAKYLSKTNIRITAVGSAEEAEAKLASKWSVIICDEHLPDGRGSELITLLRDGGNRTPMVLVTADTSPKSRELLGASAADALIYKPINESLLQRTLATLLAAPQRDGTSVSSLDPGDPAYKMVPDFAKTLVEQGEAMEQAARQKDAAECIRICLLIKGSAGALGFDPIGVDAGKVCGMIRGASWNTETNAAIRSLVQTLKGVGVIEDAADAA
jgi:CheY-like chemotaxis protein